MSASPHHSNASPRPPAASPAPPTPPLLMASPPALPAAPPASGSARGAGVGVEHSPWATSATMAASAALGPTRSLLNFAMSCSRCACTRLRQLRRSRARRTSRPSRPARPSPRLYCARAAGAAPARGPTPGGETDIVVTRTGTFNRKRLVRASAGGAALVHVRDRRRPREPHPRAAPAAAQLHGALVTVHVTRCRNAHGAGGV